MDERLQEEDEEQVQEVYEDQFILFSNRVEKAVISIVILLFFALALIQLLLQHPYVRYTLVKVEQLEGKPYVEMEVGK